MSKVSMFQLTKEQFEIEMKNRRRELVDEFTEEDKFGGIPAFFVHRDTLLSVVLKPSEKLLWINGVLGTGLEWLWELKRFGLSQGYEWLGFKVREDKVFRKSFVRFCKARLMASTPSGEEYCAQLKAR